MRPQIIVGTAVVRHDGGFVEQTVRALRLACCPGLAVTEDISRAGSWVVTHEASGGLLSPISGDYAAPAAAALAYMVELAKMPIDWTRDAAAVKRKGQLTRSSLPDFGPGWVPRAMIDRRRKPVAISDNLTRGCW